MIKGHRAKIKKIISAVLCALLVLVAFQTAVWAVELGDINKLTVHVPQSDDDTKIKLQDSDVVIELYQLAKANPVEGADAYTFEFIPAYAGITVAGTPIQDLIGGDTVISTEQWEDVARQAAAIIASEESRSPKYSYTGQAGVQITDIAPGLYLIVSHGKDASDYWTKKTNDQGVTSSVTAIKAGGLEYYILPSLISLPTKEATEEEEIITTATPGAWVYEREAFLKLESAESKGSIRITKQINEFHSSSYETFVFRVVATDPTDPKYSFSDVVGITFDKETGTLKSSIVKGIRIGADVTVTEVYSGANYNLVSAESITLTLEPDETVKEGEPLLTFTFKNEYSDTGKQGHGIQNTFTYKEDKHWKWEKDPDTGN